MNQPQKDIYGKVDGNKIIEFPVTVDVILNRGHSVYDYSPVIFDVKPNIDSTRQKLSQALSVNQGQISVKYTVTPLTLSEVLASFKLDDGFVLAIEQVPPQTVAYVKTLMSNLVETKIHVLCYLRGYESLNNALGRYSSSKNERYKKEAAYIQQCLDEAWDALEAYQADLFSKKVALPTTEEEVINRLSIPSDWSAFKP